MCQQGGSTSVTTIEPACPNGWSQEDERHVLDAAVMMDQNECNFVIPASRGAALMGPVMCVLWRGGTSQLFEQGQHLNRNLAAHFKHL